MTYLAAMALAFGALLAVPGADAAGTAPAPDDATLFVAQHLDVLSIPSSIYPHRRPGANTFADYGFDRFEAIDGGVQSVNQDKTWLIGIKIIEDNSGLKTLCMQDHATDDTTPPSQTTVEVKVGLDGLFHGTGRTPLNPHCPPYHQ